MLKRFLFLFVCISLAQDGVRVRAADVTPPTAEAIFDAYLRARGGEDALNSLGAIERIGWISTFMGDGGLQAGTYHTCIRYPDRIAIEIDAGAFQLAQAVRADGAVECSRGFAACRPASKEVANQLIDTARHANKDLLDKKDLWRAAAVTPLWTEQRGVWPPRAPGRNSTGLVVICVGSGAIGGRGALENGARSKASRSRSDSKTTT